MSVAGLSRTSSTVPGAMPRARRIDANQPEAVDYLRAVGWSVHITSMLGGGFPDFICARDEFTALVELKDGSKPPSARRLTPDEERFYALWQGVYIVATSGEDANKQLMRRMRSLMRP